MKNFLKITVSLLALFGAVLTSGMELTSLRRIRRGWNISLQDDTVSLQIRVWHRNSREQSLCIRMKRICKNILCFHKKISPVSIYTELVFLSYLLSLKSSISALNAGRDPSTVA